MEYAGLIIMPVGAGTAWLFHVHKSVEVLGCLGVSVAAHAKIVRSSIFTKAKEIGAKKMQLL